MMGGHDLVRYPIFIITKLKNLFIILELDYQPPDI